MALLLDLESDQLSLNDGDPISTWADQSGNGYDFTQSGSARPTYEIDIDGRPCVTLNGTSQWLLGPNFADNLASFTVFMVAIRDLSSGENAQTIGKINNYLSGDGWSCTPDPDNLLLQSDGGSNYIYMAGTMPFQEKHLATAEKRSNTAISIFVDGTDTTFDAGSSGTVSSFSNSENVQIGTMGVGNHFFGGTLYAVRIYAPAPNAVDRAAIEAELGARYGVEPYLGDIFVSVNPSSQRIKGVRIYP